MAPPPGPAPQPWGQQHPRGRTGGTRGGLESVELPPSVEQGMDMIYIDEDLVPRVVQDPSMLHDISFDSWSDAPVDMFVSMNPIYTELRRGLVRYREKWGGLPRIAIPAGPALKAGSTGERVDLLRTRMGLPPGGRLRRGAGQDSQGISSRSWPQGRRRRRCRNDQIPEPRLRNITSS